MSAKVWISGLFSNFDVGMKQGIRTKFLGHDWEPASFDLDPIPDEVYESHRRYFEGQSLALQDFPEAGAVWNQRQFEKVQDVLWLARST